jgi:hypothetical protein
MGGLVPIPMPARKPAAPAPPSPASRERREGLVVRLQIAAAVFGPMLLLAIWLQSRGFFGAPGI